MKTLLAILAISSAGLAADFPKFDAQEIDPHAGEVVYAVTTADVNGDTKPDVVAVTEDAVLWYENPSWTKHTITKGKTERDNVCIAAHDIDGDGQIDFALGAGWHPATTTAPSTLQWVGRDKAGEWQIHPIKYDEPTLHRLRFANVLPGGKTQLVVVPLQGRGTKGPNWGEGEGTKVQVFTIPDDPTSPDWTSEVAVDALHTTHNFEVTSWNPGLTPVFTIVGWEGVFTLRRSRDGTWSRTQLGTGNQESSPFKGASEVKFGTADKSGHSPFLATIEPWHGNQLVVYRPEFTFTGQLKPGLWARTVVAEPIAWGHALWCEDLDGDGGDEIVVGQRDPNKTGEPKGPGVYAFRPQVARAGGPPEFTRHTIDDGGMACEDLIAVDLDGDGRPEIVAGGRATHNVKIYWNKGK